MRFLADESCDFAIVHALRANGYDVSAVSEITPRAEDSDVIKERRIRAVNILDQVERITTSISTGEGNESGGNNLTAGINWWRCRDLAGAWPWKGHNINEASSPEARQRASPRTLRIRSLSVFLPGVEDRAMDHGMLPVSEFHRASW
jgi:hypothetical protein